MVGEVRDKETAEIALDAAMTGHLVFTTLHTIDGVDQLDGHPEDERGQFLPVGGAVHRNLDLFALGMIEDEVDNGKLHYLAAGWQHQVI